MDISYEDFVTEKPISFSAHSSIGCGGEASVAYFPQSIEQVEWIVRKLCQENKPYYTVGAMTNILPPDGRLEKVVLGMSRLKGIHKLFVLAGTTGGELLAYCRKHLYSGAEFLYGIPCTLGGVLYMNAGVAGQYISDIVENVTVLRNGKQEIVSVEDCAYGYKTSVFMQNGDIILGAQLRLQKADAIMIENRLHSYRERRKHLPKGKSMGCVFKNPNGMIAGKLIEGAGLKGLRIGGATVSSQHANFIINENGATASEIKQLISIIKNAVFAQYKVQLEEEIRYLT